MTVCFVERRVGQNERGSAFICGEIDERKWHDDHIAEITDHETPLHPPANSIRSSSRSEPPNTRRPFAPGGLPRLRPAAIAIASKSPSWDRSALVPWSHDRLYLCASSPNCRQCHRLPIR